MLSMRVFLWKTFSRPLRFSGIDSSAPLPRRMCILLHRGGGVGVELIFHKKDARLGAMILGTTERTIATLY